MKSTVQGHLITTAVTDPGVSGKNNEDRFSITTYHSGNSDKTPVLLAVLADGIGGHRAGEIAADIVVNRVVQHIAQSSEITAPSILIEAMHLASQEVYSAAIKDTKFYGMGATCVCALIIGDYLYIAAVGDSRIYHIRNKSIQQITIDHTWIREALDKGLLQPEQVYNHPNAHVIRRYMGSPNPPDVDVRLRLSNDEPDEKMLGNQGYKLEPHDKIILCSDGLTDLVSDPEILAAFQRKPMQEAVQYLIHLANRRGGFDNITIIAIQIPEGIKETKKKRSWRWSARGISHLVISFLAFRTG
jgi:PPM family protein phosphatase